VGEILKKLKFFKKVLDILKKNVILKKRLQQTIARLNYKDILKRKVENGSHS